MLTPSYYQIKSEILERLTSVTANISVPEFFSLATFIN